MKYPDISMQTSRPAYDFCCLQRDMLPTFIVHSILIATLHLIQTGSSKMENWGKKKEKEED